MPRVTKKQALIASKKFKSKRRYKPKLETLLDNLNNQPAFVEVLCNALNFYREYQSSYKHNDAEQQICCFLSTKFEELR